MRGPVGLTNPPNGLALLAMTIQLDLLKRFRLMLAVQSCLQKYFCSRLTQIKSISPPSCPTKGRIAIVTDAGRDAMDAGACHRARIRATRWIAMTISIPFASRLFEN